MKFSFMYAKLFLYSSFCIPLAIKNGNDPNEEDNLSTLPVKNL